MKKSIDELSDEEFVQQLIAKLENLKAEADFVYSPPPLPGKEERYYESYISWAENLLIIVIAAWCAMHLNFLQKQ